MKALRGIVSSEMIPSESANGMRTMVSDSNVVPRLGVITRKIDEVE
jgi:hypothetical protein